MKFAITLSKKFLVLSTIFAILLVLNVECLKEKKTNEQNNIEGSAVSDVSLERNRRKYNRYSNIFTNPPVQNKTNVTFARSMNENINKSIENVDLRTFRIQNANSKFHQLFDKQLEEIFTIFKNNKMAGVSDFRSSYNLFVYNFDKCDKNKNHLLDLPEFTNCLKYDPYLSLIQMPNKLYASYVNNTYTNKTGFASILFSFMDNHDRGSLNLYDYVMLRLFAFAWRKCSVNGPFIDATSFECAVDIISNSRSLHTNSLRKIYTLGLELTNSHNLRTMDFISYFVVSSSIRLYGKINAREDYDATRNEFNIALDTNILPARYNQHVIDDLYKLIKNYGNSKTGIDLLSFVFYDHFLKLFYQGAAGDHRWNIDAKQFNKILNNYLFPAELLNYVKVVPQHNYTVDSYNLRRHVNENTFDETDNLYKFLEIKSENSRINTTKVKITLPANRLFTLLDSNDDLKLTFYDFATFVQTFRLYAEVDELRHADRNLVGAVAHHFTEYADTPLYSDSFREKSRRFGMIEKDSYIDPFYTLAIMRMEDIVLHHVRKSDPTTLKEIEIRLILEKMNLKEFPVVFIEKCSRGKDEDGIPKFDWECSLIKAISRTLNFLEHDRDMNDLKEHKFNLTYTQIDSAYRK